MKTAWVMFFLAIAILQVAVVAGDSATDSFVRKGDVPPTFQCRTIAGEEFSLSGEKGKVVLINFFSTHCGPCLAELPPLDKRVYQKHKDDPRFKMIAIGRESAAELAKFKKERALTLPMASDPKRKIYGKFAENRIPRVYVIGKDGKVKLTSRGFTERGVQAIVETVEKELD